MKILYVITGLGVGGAEKVVTTIADKMISYGHSVKIVYLTGSPETLPSSPEIEIIKLNLNSIFNLLLCIKSLRSLINNYNPDIVHSHMFHSNILCRITRYITPINKLICTVHNSNEGNKLRMIAYKLTNSKADINTNVSREATASLISKGAFKECEIQTIYNGIDTQYFKFNDVDRERLRNSFGIGKNSKVLIAVGSLSTQKDYPNLFNALSILDNEIDYKIFIVGDGILKSHLESIVSEKKLQNNIVFLGIRKDIPALLSMSDIFVLPSAWEGFGLVVAEAMACERIVVATDCGGVSEVLGDAGILVPNKNSIRLAEGLKKALMLNDESCFSMGKRARKRVLNHYSLDISSSTWLDLYKKLIY